MNKNQATRALAHFFHSPEVNLTWIRSSDLDRNLTQDVEIQVVVLVARGGKEVQGTHEFLLGEAVWILPWKNEVRNMSEAEKILINIPTIIGVEWML